MSKNCHDCGVDPRQLHKAGCDVERCPTCGGQMLGCGCPEEDQRDRLPWTGEWPGDAECREFGWYCDRDNPCRRCSADDPNATEDLNRLAREARWDRAARRFVRKETSK